jgi:hypothetical protein
MMMQAVNVGMTSNTHQPAPSGARRITMSWEQQIAEAAPGKARALVYLERAQGRSSKRLIASDINAAIDESDAISGIIDLLGLYGQSASAEGLVKTAECFAKDILDPQAWAAYHAKAQ